MANFLLHHMAIPQGIFHLSAILFAFLATYLRILGKDFFWVIDDVDGIARFSDRWQPETADKDGKITGEQKIDSYECCGGTERKHQVKNLAFNPHVGFPGCVLRFIRLHVGKQYHVIATNKKGHDVWGYTQSPRRHHAFSITVQAVNLCLGYAFLSRVVSPEIAFAACILYAVHPLTTQVVGWISGIPYSISMLFALLAINSSFFCLNTWPIRLSAVFTFVSATALYIGSFTFIPMLFLGFKGPALASAIVGLSVLLWKGRETKNVRSAAFKAQNMGGTLTLNWRKPIVMLKTLWYYTGMVFLPIRMGLYHVWGYFYEDPIERFNGMFLLGLLAFAAFTGGYIYGDFAIRLGIVWFFSYLFIFTNFITAQQFVADRYATVPAFGICIILASLFHDTPILYILVGLYAMRTFTHLNTFKNEVDFYLSNFMNFRKSEISLGNLGVAYMNANMPGSAVDTWMMATKVNPLYDVSWYNLYSIFRSNGRLQEALDFLRKVMDSKVIHFEEQWRKELENFEAHVNGQTTKAAAPSLDLIDNASQQWRRYGKH